MLPCRPRRPAAMSSPRGQPSAWQPRSIPLPSPPSPPPPFLPPSPLLPPPPLPPPEADVGDPRSRMLARAHASSSPARMATMRRPEGFRLEARRLPACRIRLGGFSAGRRYRRARWWRGREPRPAAERRVSVSRKGSGELGAGRSRPMAGIPSASRGATSRASSPSATTSTIGTGGRAWAGGGARTDHGRRAGRAGAKRLAQARLAKGWTSRVEREADERG